MDVRNGPLPLTVLGGALVLAACGRGPPPASASTPTSTPGSLAGTHWRLIGFQSMDDSQGTTKPADPSRFTMDLNADGTVTMQLDCNRARGSWTARPSAEGTSGEFKFGLLAGTMALCPPPNLDEKITTQARYVTSYLLRDGNLYLNLMADGGAFAWEPVQGAPAQQ